MIDGDVFPDRKAAGRLVAAMVADYLRRHGGPGDPLVLALPRGGVVVAAEVARVLPAELDVVVARKVGLPWQPELGAGAVTEQGQPVFNDDVLGESGLTPDDLASAVRRERDEAARRVRRYRNDRPPPRIEGRVAIVVDDGIATGVSARAALRSVRAERPARLLFAAPVCAAPLPPALSAEADAFLCARNPTQFISVGTWYADFPQVTDEEVEQVLTQAWQVRTHAG